MKTLYLITGICGHLGSTVTGQLIEEGKELKGFDVPGSKLNCLNSKSVEMVYGNICKIEELEQLFAGNEDSQVIVIHLAGIVSIASKFNQLVYDVNVNGTKNVIQLCEKYKVKKLVHISTVHAIAEKPKGETISEVEAFDPDKVVGLYAKTKAEATQAVLDAASKGLDVSVIHPSGIVGPFDYGRGHITQLVLDFAKGKLIAAINGGYDFVDVRDVAAGIISCCDKGEKGQCYILSNKYYTVKEIVDMLAMIIGKRKIKIYLPMGFAKITVPLAEIYYKILKQPPLFTSYSLFTLQTNSEFSHEKATKVLGYRTREMEETLRDTVKWMKENGRI